MQEYATKINSAKYPRFFMVDDLPVVINFDKGKNEVFGLTSTGHLYPPFKAKVDGHEISQAEYHKELKKHLERIANAKF